MTAQATSKLNCGFTEPFFSLEIDLAKALITRTEYDWDDKDPNSDYITTTVAENIKVEVDNSDPFLPKYALKTQDGEVFANILMNMAGSDGMSDIIYPFDIRYSDYWGGCTSDLISSFDPNRQ